MAAIRLFGGKGYAGKKVTKAYSINCNPFSRAMVSPLSTEDITPGGSFMNIFRRFVPLIMM
jgi:hypothetical protein